MSEGGEEYDDRKLFVGGLSWATTEESLRDYFSQFGELQEVTVKTDRESHRPRGFGFVKFKDQQCIHQVLDCGKIHELDGKKIDPKRATKSDKGDKTKVFVGGIPALEEGETVANLASDLQKFLEEVGGTVTSVDIKVDQTTHRHKGFGFVTFENSKGAEDVCSRKFFDFRNKKIDCKKADPRQSRQGGGGYSAGAYYYPQHPQQQHWESGGGYPGSQAGAYAYDGGSGAGSGYSYGVHYPSQSYPQHHQAPQDTSGGQMTTGYDSYAYSHGSSRGDASGYGSNYPSYAYSGQGGHAVGYGSQHQHQHQQQQSSYYGHQAAQPHHN